MCCRRRWWWGQAACDAPLQVVLELGPLKLPLPVKADGRGFVEWLHLEEDFRISRGNKGSVFIHTRERA